MIFEGRFNRARKTQRYNSGMEEDLNIDVHEHEEKIKLEKGDFVSMLLASFYTLFLPAVAVLIVILAIALLFFRLL